jgi:hypothetical protein
MSHFILINYANEEQLLQCKIILNNNINNNVDYDIDKKISVI